MSLGVSERGQKKKVQTRYLETLNTKAWNLVSINEQVQVPSKEGKLSMCIILVTLGGVCPIVFILPSEFINSTSVACPLPWYVKSLVIKTFNDFCFFTVDCQYMGLSIRGTQVLLNIVWWWYQVKCFSIS